MRRSKLLSFGRKKSVDDGAGDGAGGGASGGGGGGGGDGGGGGGGGSGGAAAAAATGAPGGNPFEEARESLLFHNLPLLPVRPLTDATIVAEIHGPVSGDPDAERAQSYADSVSCRSVSTYPRIPPDPNRFGDPIADYYAVKVYGDRAIVCIADGCNWGAKVAEAASRAARTFVDALAARIGDISDTKQCRRFLLDACADAHLAIFEGKAPQDGHHYNVGQTTLLGGLLLPIEGADQFCPGYEFVCVSVGDCKAFMYTNGRIEDITSGNRQNVSDARDCGGRLGSARDQRHCDDLRRLAELDNLELFSQPCEEGDVLILVTDGVHDNLDPQHLGKAPRDMPKSMTLGDHESWDDVDPAKAEAAKNTFRVAFLERHVQGARTPTELTNKLIDHCIKTTSATREYMVANKGARVAKDYVTWPGKLDHSSILCVKVGAFVKADAAGEGAGAGGDDGMLDLGDLAQ